MPNITNVKEPTKPNHEVHQGVYESLPKAILPAIVSTMGDDKVVIYVPREYHKTLLADFKAKPLKVTIEEILDD